MSNRKLLKSVLGIFNGLIFLAAISLSVFTFTNIDNWALLILWFITLPVHFSMIVFGIILLIIVLKNKNPQVRGLLLNKWLPIMAVVNIVCIVIFVIILLTA